MAKVVTEEMQTTPDLEQAMREGQQTFDGGIPETAAAPLIPGTTGPDEKKDAEREEEQIPAGGKKTAAGEAAPTEEETPEQIAARTKKEDTPPETAFRFKDHSEAEKGYRELQGKATKAEQRAKAVEDELNRVKNAEKIAAEKVAARATIIDFAATRRAQALEEIDGLDPEDKEYRKKAATLLSQADIDIYDHYQTHGRTAQPAAPATPETVAVEGSAPVEVEKVTKYVQEQLVAEGFDANDPLFWQYAGDAPINDEKGKPITLDMQIKWAVSQTKQYHDNIRTKLKSEDEARVTEEVRKKQAADLPLGRGTPGGGGTSAGKGAKAEEENPVSLSDAIDFAQDRRRL
jgi:hypothetical protein